VTDNETITVALAYAGLALVGPFVLTRLAWLVRRCEIPLMRPTALLVLVVALASGCSSLQPDAGPPHTTLLTNVEYDGHLWVASYYCGIQITAMEHHPDCPCTKRSKGQRDEIASP
jgi:hypothetical protein